ncbi:MAG: hypothetical protein HRT36_04805 [Alphaproteobacteria bacterium]|nr:hypothetical protein [Alphaproteobacteria bacterium]
MQPIGAFELCGTYKVPCRLALLLPITDATIYFLSIAMGLLWLIAVPLTNGMIHRFYGQRYAGHCSCSSVIRSVRSSKSTPQAFDAMGSYTMPLGGI